MVEKRRMVSPALSLLTAAILAGFTRNSLLTAAQSCPNSKGSPFMMTIKNWGINEEMKAPSLLVGVGSPAQQLVPVLLSFRFNYTYLLKAGVAEDADKDRLSFNYKLSSSFDLISTLPKANLEATGFGGVYGNDTFSVLGKNSDEKRTVNDFPLGVVKDHNPSVQPIGPNSMGLTSRNSAVLNYFWTSGQIPGRGFGLQTGLFVPGNNDRLQGELVLGGYDKKKISGKVHEFDILRKNQVGGLSPYVVTVSGITVDFDGTGKNVTDLFVANVGNQQVRLEKFPAMLEQRLPYLEFPSAIAKNYAAATNATRIRTFLQVDKNFTGHMTITLDSGLEVQIPAAVLNQYFGEESGSAMRVYDDFPAINNLSMLGAHFMSEVYMYADFEKQDAIRSGVFGLANVVRNTDTDIVAICSSDSPENEDKDNGNNNGDNNDNANNDEGLSKGAIAGIAVGGAVVGITALGLLFLFWKRQKRIAAQRALHRPVEVAGYPVSELPMPEMAVTTQEYCQPPVELDGSSDRKL